MECVPPAGRARGVTATAGWNRTDKGSRPGRTRLRASELRAPGQAGRAEAAALPSGLPQTSPLAGPVAGPRRPWAQLESLMKRSRGLDSTPRGDALPQSQATDGSTEAQRAVQGPGAHGRPAVSDPALASAPRRRAAPGLWGPAPNTDSFSSRECSGPPLPPASRFLVKTSCLGERPSSHPLPAPRPCAPLPARRSCLPVAATRCAVGLGLLYAGALPLSSTPQTPEALPTSPTGE